VRLHNYWTRAESSSANFVRSLPNPTANQKYLWILRGEMTGTASTTDVSVTATNSSGSTLWLSQERRTGIANAWQPFFGAYVVDYGGTPPAQDICTVALGSSTYSMRNVTLAIFELQDSDESAYTALTSAATTSSTSFVDSETLTFTTPNTTDADYLILAFADAAQTSTSIVHSIRLLDSASAAQYDLDLDVYATTNHQAWGAVGVYSLTANTSYTFKIQQHSSAATNVTTRATCILAIRLDEYHDYGEVYEASTGTETGTSYVNFPMNDSGGTGFTPSRASEFVLFWVGTHWGSGSFNRDSYLKLWQPTLGDLAEVRYKTPSNAENHSQVFCLHRFRWGASSFVPVAHQKRGLIGATSNCGGSNSGR